MFTHSAISTLILLLTVSAAFATRPTPAEARRRDSYDRRVGHSWDHWYRAAARIRPKDGIGEFEAYVLANAYRGSQISLCGDVRLPKRRGAHWLASTRIGYGAASGPQIIVDAKTGVTHASGYPKIRDSRRYLEFLLNSPNI